MAQEEDKFAGVRRYEAKVVFGMNQPERTFQFIGPVGTLETLDVMAWAAFFGKYRELFSAPSGDAEITSFEELRNEFIARETQTQEYVDSVCKPGTVECCRYLVFSPKDKWGCEKNTPTGLYLDRRVEDETINARGDNCGGVL